MYQRIGMILMQYNGQAVGQLVLGVRNGNPGIVTFKGFDQRDAFGQRRFGRCGGFSFCRSRRFGRLLLAPGQQHEY